ncbi:hypothetical protein [Clostridium autoethanogenum]|uniref:hypothetical protein n=1 Tax=Clostridium autoethanogenum TaxID=84023 RepID=UPI001604FD9F|nr:hypothetical protein [Clostridium autoethanogenum]
MVNNKELQNLNSVDLDLIKKISSQVINIIIENGLNTRQVDILLELIQAQIKECKLSY